MSEHLYHENTPDEERARLRLLVTLWCEMGSIAGAEVREHGDPEASDPSEAACSLIALDTVYRQGERVAVIERRASGLEGYSPGVVCGAYLGCMIQAALRDVLSGVGGPVDFVTAHDSPSPDERASFRRAYAIVRSYTLIRYDDLRQRAAEEHALGDEEFASACIRCLAICRSLARADIVSDAIDAPGPLGDLRRLSESWEL